MIITTNNYYSAITHKKESTTYNYKPSTFTQLHMPGKLDYMFFIPKMWISMQEVDNYEGKCSNPGCPLL